MLRFSAETTLTPGNDFFSLLIGEPFDVTIRQLRAVCLFLPRRRGLPEGTLTIFVDHSRSSSNPNEISAFLNSVVFVIFSKSFETTTGNSEILPTL